MGGVLDGAWRTARRSEREVKIFRFGRVGDGDANFAETTGRQRPPDSGCSDLDVRCLGGAAGGGKSNSLG